MDLDQYINSLIEIISESKDTEWKKNLAPGQRFLPTDSELLKHYLVAKVEGSYIFPGIVYEDFDVYSCHPLKLPSAIDKGSEYAYFFTLVERKSAKGKRAERCTKDGKGHWKMTSSIHEIFDDIDGSLLGRKNTLVYFQKAVNQKGFGVKTNWIMHEYVLDERLVPIKENESNEKEYDVVLCRIRHREEKKGKTEIESGSGSYLQSDNSFRQSVPIDRDWRAWIEEVERHLLYQD